MHPEQFPSQPEGLEQERSPEQEKARAIMRQIAEIMDQRAETNSILKQASWRGNRGASIMYMHIANSGGAVKVHGAGGTYTASEYTFATSYTPEGSVQEELTVQHPTEGNAPITDMNAVDIAFLGYVHEELLDPNEEVTPDLLNKLQGL